MAVVALQIDSLGDAFPSEYVMASSYPLGESQIPKQTTQTVEADIGIRQEFFPLSKLNPSSPATFPWASRIVSAVASCLWSQTTSASSSSTLFWRGLRRVGLRPRRFGVRPFREPSRLALRQAVRWELYRPSRRTIRPTSPGSEQPSVSSGILSLYAAVNRRRVGLATTSGSGARLRSVTPALGAANRYPIAGDMADRSVGFRVARTLRSRPGGR